MKFFHADVFSREPLKGNGLTVVFPDKDLSRETMLAITREFRQFETIFIFPEESECYPVRIFTVDEELHFAGHPILGAAAVIHRLFEPEASAANIKFLINGRVVAVRSDAEADSYRVVMNQGVPEFIQRTAPDDCRGILSALNLSAEDLHPDYPVETVSTGLPYLLLPLKKNIEKAEIISDCFEELLSKYHAKFVYLFEPETMECRTWDNAGITEDVATGSAAGPLCAYLVNNNFKKSDEIIKINQGKFLHRPSIIRGWVSAINRDVFIEGDVAIFSCGEIFI